MFLFLVGCDGGMSSIGGGSDDFPQSVGGTKVLKRPPEYSFSEAVGEYASEYYYNIFADRILVSLYEVYAQNLLTEDSADTIFADIDLTQGETYTTFTGDNQYFLYDSLRYSITNIETTYDRAGGVEKQVFTVDTSYAWNWSIENDATNRNDTTANTNRYENMFYLLKEVSPDEVSIERVENNLIVTINGSDLFDVINNALDNGRNFIPSYSEVYFGNRVLKEGVENVTNYYTSPYYDINVAGQGVSSLLNYFQDALEYATYLFVLGYDYVDAAGNVSEDAPFFDFNIEYNANGIVQNTTVGGWETNPISIGDALDRVKERYVEQGNIVGITNTIKEQIIRFIKDQIIGENAMSQGVLEVTRQGIRKDENNVNLPAVDETSLTFNRNYDKIVENIVNYACSQAPIGRREDGTNLTLDNAYPISEIAEYAGDYFFQNHEVNGEDSDEELFMYIEAAEYQDLIIYPNDEDLGGTLQDIFLAFEYYENPDPTKVMAESITINVGLRYFDCSANNGEGLLTDLGVVQKEILYGKNGDIEGETPDINYVSMGYSDIDPDQYDLKFPEPISIKSQFNNNIGNGVINPFVSGTQVNESYYSQLITGSSDARDWYKSNPSSSYGTYYTLDESKFSQSAAGDEACDFIEIYFDIVKDKNTPNINYNFKVSLWWWGVYDN